MNYATQLDRALTRQEAMETRDADAEAKRELWEIARKKEQARRQALLRQVQGGEVPVVGPAACTQISGDRAARVRVFFCTGFSGGDGNRTRVRKVPTCGFSFRPTCSPPWWGYNGTMVNDNTRAENKTSDISGDASSAGKPCRCTGRGSPFPTH